MHRTLIIDFGLGSVLLLLLLPLLLALALAVICDSPGPALFTQSRVGREGRPFALLKFRTMRHAPDGQLQSASRDDPRVTRLGRLLRKSSLDELPQLFNVLRGEMSLVGPRPHALSHDARFAKLVEGYVKRYGVKPGMTGWAQVHGARGSIDTLAKLQQRTRYDLYYIEHQSLLLDLHILCRTVFVVLHRNAY